MHAANAELFYTQLWARSVLASSNLTPSQIDREFFGRNSSFFHYLGGKNALDLRRGAARLTPLILIETAVPGTLKWLLHWSRLFVEFHPNNLPDVRAWMSIAPTERRRGLFVGTPMGLRRRNGDPRAEVARLSDEWIRSSSKHTSQFLDAFGIAIGWCTEASILGERERWAEVTRGFLWETFSVSFSQVCFLDREFAQSCDRWIFTYFIRALSDSSYIDTDELARWSALSQLSVTKVETNGWSLGDIAMAAFGPPRGHDRFL